MSWLLSKLTSSSTRSDNVIVENTTETSPSPGGNQSNYENSPLPGIYPGIPQSSYPTPALPYNIMPTPTIPARGTTHIDRNVLPYTLDEMKVKFKFLYDSHFEDMETNQLIQFINKTKQSNQSLEALFDDINKIDFELERSVVSST